MIILPDTNTLLHFKRPDQVDWQALVGTRDVEIVLAAVPVHEIDKHAIQHNIARTRERARDLKSWIRTLLKAEGGARIESREPTAFLTDGLDPNVPDDRLIATALMLQAEGHEVAIYTDDTLIHAKARGRPIQVIFPLETDKLKEEPDPLRKENEELRRELNTIKLRQPRLSLGWGSGDSPLVIAMPAPAIGDVRSAAQERQILRPLPDPDQPSAGGSTRIGGVDLAAIGRFSSFGPSQQEVASYNQDLEAYHQAYERYIADLERWAYIRSRVVALSFIAKNDGSAPASSFRASISLPKGLTLIEDEDDIGDRPKPPRQPSKPGRLGLLEAIHRGDRSSLHPLFDPASLAHPGTWDDSPYVDISTNTLELRRPKLLQHNPFIFDSAYVLVDENFDGKGGALDVRLTAEELAAPLTFKLPFRVTGA